MGCCSSTQHEATKEADVVGAVVAIDSDGFINRQEEGHDKNEQNDEEASEEDLFFSARLSLSELAYPPASSHPFLGRSSNVSLDVPQSLLRTTSSQKLLLSSRYVSAKQNSMAKIHEVELPQKRPTVLLAERLTAEPESTEVVVAGYPGTLQASELEACLEFRRRLKEHSDPTYRAMVHMNVDIDVGGDNNAVENGNNAAGRGPEEEAFALCRFLRARKFDVDQTLAMMDEHVDLFRDALTNHDLHRNKSIVESHIGCPLPVFASCFPIVYHGIARSGAFVLYLRAGSIRLPDGFDCINTAETPEAFVERYMPMVWYTICRYFCETMDRLQKENETKKRDKGDNDSCVVLAEAVVVMDLDGLQKDLIGKRTMEFVRQLFGVIECFPEMLNRVVVLNVPYFFTCTWKMFKRFIDARTVRKIGFFSSMETAKGEITSLVDPSQVLAEYGGATGTPTYEEALAIQMKRDGTHNRYVVERYNSSSVKKGTKDPVTIQTFSLNESEGAELTVYTQAKLDATSGDKRKNGTQFWLLPKDSSIEREGGISDDSGENKGSRSDSVLSSRFGQPAATTKEYSMVRGPGEFRIVATKHSKDGPKIEKALLVVSIR